LANGLSGFDIQPALPLFEMWQIVYRLKKHLSNPMKSIHPIFGALFLLILLSSASAPAIKKSNLYISDYENVLGTSLEIKIAANGKQNAAKAEEAALAEVDRLNKILSGYDASSEFSQWLKSGGKQVKVSAELYELLSLFEQWRIKSHGVLDASAETVGKVWKNAAKQNRLPSSAEIATAVNEVKQQHYVLNEANGTAAHIGNAPLMLNSFAKSYIMDKAANVAMATPGVNGLVINIGGDILVRGIHTEQVQVSNPKADAENDAPIAKVLVNNKTIATSGNYRRGEEINGKWYSHIVDPRTGQPANGIISATVIAANATDAGALATALNVLNPEEGKELVATIPGAEYMLITAEGKQFESKGWKKAELPESKAPVKPIAANAKDKLWDPNYELAINLELATIEGMRVHRPYVAVWAVDADKKPVRQIALWYNKSKYLDDMRSWYSTYYDIFSAGNSSIKSTTSATRSPGKYTLKWDGKDDKGALVKEGAYTIYIEAAREHGTYQLMKQAITVNKSQHIEIEGNTEVSAVSLDFRKKTDGN
jgi:thiamine biosynthesis lipoprotein